MFSALQVIAAPASEPVSVDLAKLHTRIDHDADDELIAGYITAARTWAEQFLGRALVSQQLRWIVGQDQPSSGSPWLSMPLQMLVMPMWFRWPLIHQQALQLPRQPVISVDAVAYGQWGQADTVLVAGTDYAADVATAQLHIRPYSQVIPNDHLSVTFTAGYAAIPQPIITAIMMLTAFMYENRGDAGADMPKAAMWLMTPFRLVTFG